MNVCNFPCYHLPSKKKCLYCPYSQFLGYGLRYQTFGLVFCLVTIPYYIGDDIILKARIFQDYFWPSIFGLE